MSSNFDFCIAGGGMVGLSIANQLIERKISSKIVIIDKEKELGKHSSDLIVEFCMLDYIMNQNL